MNLNDLFLKFYSKSWLDKNDEFDDFLFLIDFIWAIRFMEMIDMIDWFFVGSND